MPPEQQSPSLNIAILIASDTRDFSTDKSGQLLAEKAAQSGHHVIEKIIVADNIYQIRAHISRWIADDSIQVVISTGGTGVSGRDGTPEAVLPLLDKTLDGFGEIFRMLSYQEIKTSSIQSRALAGVANGTYIFVLPGSSGACRLAWDELIKAQLDLNTRPCNLAQLMPRLTEK